MQVIPVVRAKKVVVESTAKVGNFANMVDLVTVFQEDVKS